MFREMRRKKQALPQDTCAAILREGSAGVLALEGGGGLPLCGPPQLCLHRGENLLPQRQKRP